MTAVLRTIGLFALTALCEIAGCYLALLWIRYGGRAWLAIPSAALLGAFAYLLTLHPFAAGRTYAAYGGVYVGTALVWLRLVEGIRIDRWDVIGAVVTFLGMAIIAFAPRG
jgi:small multidrug resistance family-3 protein